MTTLLLARRPAAEGLAEAPAVPPRLVDPFGRAITYVRLSVTDRYNFRCVYCIAEKMTFLPHAEVLRLEELDRLYSIFVGLGVKKIRPTGGEPLVRRGGSFSQSFRGRATVKKQSGHRFPPLPARTSRSPAHR